MPQAPLRPCRQPRCAGLVSPPASRCPAHQDVDRPPDLRISAAKRGYDRRWRTLRVMIAKDRPPLCCDCLAEGRIAIGRELDHVIPRAVGGDNDPINLAWRCRRHHAIKTARETRR
jgi:5-methylcytosine-specific restriction enzyme A